MNMADLIPMVLLVLLAVGLSVGTGLVLLVLHFDADLLGKLLDELRVEDAKANSHLLAQFVSRAE